MNNIILGNGISAYVIAACLDYFQQDFKIYCKDTNSHVPPILLLKYKNDEELMKYFKLFGIELNDKNIELYTKKINIGYLYDGVIYDNMTSEMRSSYLAKQSRQSVNSSVSDGLSSFNAILLDKVFELLKHKYSNKVEIVETYNLNLNYHNVYDTSNCKQNNDTNCNVYLINKRELDLFNYDYVYDCNIDSNVKRYSKYCTEYINKPDCECITISNYYHSPKVYIEFDMYNYTEHIYIGRYSTKTQTKQEDIIKFMFNKLGGNNSCLI